MELAEESMELTLTEEPTPTPQEPTTALQNYLIIRGIGHHLPLPSLKSFRLVNPLWNWALQHPFAQNSLVKFPSLSRLSIYNEQVDVGVHSNFHLNFWSYLSYRHPELTLMGQDNPQGVGEVPLLNSIILTKFFDKYGPFISQLTLRMNWDRASDFDSFFSQILPKKMPSLKELDLRVSFGGFSPPHHFHHLVGHIHPQPNATGWSILPRQDPSISSSCPSVRKLTLQLISRLHWGANDQQRHLRMENLPLILIQSFPHLQELIVDDCFLERMPVPQSSFYSSLFEERGALEKFPKLTSLGIGYCTDEYLRDLSTLPLTLESLSISFHDLRHRGDRRHHTLTALTGILKSQASTLKSLRLLGLQPQTRGQRAYLLLEFPKCLPQLEKLELTFKEMYEFHDGFLRVPKNTWNFPTMFPKLKSYKLLVEESYRSIFGELFRDCVQQKYLPKSICLGVEKVELQYPFVKGEDFDAPKCRKKGKRPHFRMTKAAWMKWRRDWKNAGFQFTPQERVKKWEDFVERLTLTFPNAVDVGHFPQRRPEPVEGPEWMHHVARVPPRSVSRLLSENPHNGVGHQFHHWM